MDFARLLFLVLSILLVACGLASGQRGGNRRRNQQQQDASRGGGGGIRFPEESGNSRNWGGNNRQTNNVGPATQQRGNMHQGKFPGGFYGGTKW